MGWGAGPAKKKAKTPPPVAVPPENLPLNTKKKIFRFGLEDLLNP